MKKIVYAVAAFVIIAALSTLILIFYKGYKEKHAPSTVVMPLTEYYGVAPDEALIILDEEVYEKRGLWKDGTAYLDLDTVRKMYDHRFFWVENEYRMIYTTATQLYHFMPGGKEFTLNDEGMESATPVVQIKDGTPYIAVDFLRSCCGMTCTIATDPARVMVSYSHDSFLCARVEKDTQIRVSQDIKADVLTELFAGDTIRFIDGGGIRENGFVKVMSKDGVRGYMLESALSESYYTGPEFVDFTPQEYTHILSDEKIYLGWQLLYTTDSVSMLKNALKNAPEVNVVAPTWFFLTGTDGEFNSYANADYIQAAHDLGVQVWATYKNDSKEGEFSCSEDSHTILSSTVKRRAMIDNMLELADRYGFDGINVDYENLKLDSGVFFIEFLRELSIRCREKGIILSVDNYVPAGYNAYYDLEEQGKILDYVVIMGYDEHYAGSDEAGSVSSLGWFKEAVENTAEKVDPRQVVMGLPFYSRLWKETSEDGRTKVIVDATPNMDEAARIVKSNKAEKTWKDSAGQYYAEYKSGSARYRIWLEDFESISAKVYAVREYDMAGIAAWKLGDESEGTWAVITNCLEGELPADGNGETPDTDSTGE